MINIMDNLHKARLNMVAQHIRPWDVTDASVLNVLGLIPRERFVPEGYEGVAYTDTPIPLMSGQFMLEPKVTARALQALNIKRSEKVLEIGTGTGYTTALLSHLADHVYSVEINESQLTKARQNLKSDYKNVTLVLGDAALGWDKEAPYDVIFVSGSYPLGLPSNLAGLLAPNGRCFAIVGEGPAMQAVIYNATAKGLEKVSLFETCVPALMHAPLPARFTF